MGIRDEALRIALKQNKTLQKLGTIHSLNINTDTGKIELILGLKGEPSPIQFEAYYEIIVEDNQTFAQISKITSEKEWISQILNLWLENNGPIRQELKGFTGGLAKIFF